jgi:hypothetical protein
LSYLYNILSVARYERMMLFRSTRFRVLGTLGMLIPIAIGVMLAIAEARGVEFPSALAIGAFIPFYVFSFLQTVVVAFVVGDFRAGDERAHVHEVVDASPISTAELVIGKYLGATTALGALSLGVLLTTVLIQAAKISITGLPFTLEPYLVYLGVMALPSLIFVSALTFVLGAVLRKQTAVALTIGAYTIGVVLFLGRRYDGVFDFGAFFAPLFYSDLLGMGDISDVLAQRMMYVVLAFGLLGLSINRYPRLSQSSGWMWIGRGMALAGFLGSATVYGYTQRADENADVYRAQLLAEHRSVKEQPEPTITNYSISVDLLGSRGPLEATVTMNVTNPHSVPVEEMVLNLNAGLEVHEVLDAEGVLAYDRQSALLRIPNILAPGDSTTITISYSGSIDLDAFDLLKGDSRLKKSRHPFYKGDLTSWITSRSVFLPPRSRWYPVIGPDYRGERQPVYTTAEINITVPRNLTVVTQGVRTDSSSAEGRRTTKWVVDSPVPAFSLNAGVYEVFEANIHDIDMALYIHPSHLRQVRFFEGAEEQVVEAIDQIIDVMEQETGLPYPFPRLSIVEVPFQIQWYYEGWEEHGGLVQPGVLMVEEDVLMEKRFKRDLDRRKRFSRGGDSDEGQMKRDLLVSAVMGTFFGKEESRGGLFRSPVAQLWSFNRSFSGDQSALVERGLPLFLQQDVEAKLREASSLSGRRRGRFRGRGRRRPPRTDSAAWDTLMTEMGQRSFADLNPEEEPDLYRRALNAKGPTMFRMVESVVGDDSFLATLEAIGAKSEYSEVPFEDFESAFTDGIRKQDRKEMLQRLVNEWIYSTHVPGYTLTKASAVKMDDGWGAVVYQVKVRVRNAELGRGFVQVTVASQQDEAVKGVEIEGGKEVEIGLIIWDRPTRVTVDPFFARNRRPMMAPLSIPEKVVEGTPKSYVKNVEDDDSRLAEIVVDNEDEGFSMPIRRVTKYLRPLLKGGNWRTRDLQLAYGRYEKNFRWKTPGDGAQPAIWKARIPQDGEYDVAYYYPPPQMRRRLGLSKAFELKISHTAGLDTLRIESEHLTAGWNLLGRFAFSEGTEGVVELSDDSDGRLYADAVRWRYVDPENPDIAYEEDVPVFNFRGFGGRGGAGGGRQGFGGDGGGRR